MKIVNGVHLHFIKTDKFKTNHMTLRFSTPLTGENRVRRSLVAQMLATANDRYPTSQAFRQKLADLYGAHFSTKVDVKGLVHTVDVDISFLSNHYALKKENILSEIIDFLEVSLFRPLVTVERYQKKIFDVEQANLVNYIKADSEDLYYLSDLELNKLLFDNEDLQEPKYGAPEKVMQENSYTAFQEFRRMLREDRIDLFFVGDIDEYTVIQKVAQWPLENRKIDLQFNFVQDSPKIISEKLESRQTNQSILQLGYHVPTYYGDAEYAKLLLINGILGLFPHSLLFTKVREGEGLAYTISSHIHPYQGVLKIQAGISKQNRLKSLQLISKQVKAIKLGRFSAHLLSQTKKMLINVMRQAEDHPKTLVERIYAKKVVLGGRSASVDLLTEIDNIEKAELVNFARQMKLKAVYVMEGEE